MAHYRRSHHHEESVFYQDEHQQEAYEYVLTLQLLMHQYSPLYVGQSKRVY